MTQVTPKITMKQQLQTIKILGRYFNENLKLSKQINLEIILEKMQNHIKKLSSRILSLYGKTILINTLILSKTSYLSNVFPLDTDTAHKIQNKRFKYLWNNKTQKPIARKTIYLKRKRGGLNLIEPVIM